jgi:hypothetical protein
MPMNTNAAWAHNLHFLLTQHFGGFLSSHIKSILGRGRTALETLSLNRNIPGGGVGRGCRGGEGLDGEARHPHAVLLG